NQSAAAFVSTKTPALKPRFDRPALRLDSRSYCPTSEGEISATRFSHLIDTRSQLELCSYWRCHAVRAKPMISIAAATGLLEAIEAAGGSPDGILQIAGLDR